MNICQAIDLQLQKLQAQPAIDTQNISTDQYEQILDRLNKDVKQLTSIKNILNLPIRILHRINEVITKQEIYIDKIDISKLVATSEEEITEGIIVFSGDLNYETYKNLNTKIKRLPDSLRLINGNFLSFRGGLEYVELDYVNGKVIVSNCPELKEAHFGHVRGSLELMKNDNLASFSIENAVGKVVLENCINLTNTKLGLMTNSLSLKDCQSLILNNIHSYNSQDHILLTGDLYIAGTQFVNESDELIREIFNMRLQSNIIR